MAGPREARGARRWRRLGLGLLSLVVAASCLGWLGPREGTVTDETGRLTVTYPQLARSGAESGLMVEVEDAERATPVVIEVPTAAIDRLGLEGMTPEPVVQTSAGDSVRLRFAAPRDGNFSVQFAGRLPTRADLGPFSFDVRVTSGADELTVDMRTWVLP
ncbi:hypothetical protein [Aeromicrobium choanae]|uniref:hypothetical protein n=1 Tax=Aeromicrobium choanae TaxID=1736691 RepID=UPI0012947BFB|nr:hypothetical protein [Aeromicrobium choanae]